MLKPLLILASATSVLGVALNFPRAICDQYDSTIAINVISGVPSKSRFFQVKGNVPSLIGKLVENATTIRENIVDTFSCRNRVYGYYADQDNGCQIFHICVPMQQLFPDLYCADDIFHFSFICPKHTIFSQEAMVCDWADNAFPCSEADKLYDRNNLFFVVPEDDVQRESASSSTTPSTIPSQSMCCSSTSETIEARSNVKEPLQTESTSPVTEKLKTTVEIPQTSVLSLLQHEDLLPTTTITDDGLEDITTWPSVNPLIFPDTKQYPPAKSLPKSLHISDSAVLTNSLPIQKFEPEVSTQTDLLPETTYAEQLTEETVELPNSTLPPELEHSTHPALSLSAAKSSKLKNQRSDTSKEKPPIVMYIEGVGFQVLPNS